MNFIGEGFTVGPYSAVLKILLLPDGNGAFERVNQPAASVERSGTVSRGNHDQHAGFANFEASKAVHEGDIANLKLPQGLRGQGFHLLKRHLFVGFVIEIDCLASASLIKPHAFEDY